ncbi:MAG: lysophospholipid acyltransferase family protein [Bacillota bacterium]|nr:lysophospholipid acyltransferase family protein [Bacillota bacterium]
MYAFIKKLISIYYKLLFGVTYYGMDNVPADGGVLFCSNHISNNDPPLLGSSINRQLCIMAKKELFSIPVINLIIKAFGAYPIDRGTSDLGAMRTTLNILKDGGAILMFPEGRRNLSTDPEKFKPGALNIAYKALVPLVPVYIDGKYKLFGKMSVYIGKPVLPEKIGNIIKTASSDRKNKNHIVSRFLYDVIIGTKENIGLG